MTFWNVVNYVSENPLSLPLRIHCMGWPALSPGRVVLLLVTTLINKHDEHKPRYPFHGAQYQAE